MNVMRHILQILGTNQSSFKHCSTRTSQAFMTIWVDTCMWVWIRNLLRKTKSLCSVFSISTTPQGYWNEKQFLESGNWQILYQEYWKNIMHFFFIFFYLSSSHFPPSNVKNSAGSNLNCNVLKVLDSLTKWIGETRYCELSWLYQSKRKTVFQFLILLLKVVVFIWVAVWELVDLNFGLSQLLAVWNYEFLLWLGELLAFIILSFFFFTSAFVRQSAFASTGMRFTWD